MCLLGRGSLCDQPPVKTVDAESLLILTGRQHFTGDVKTCSWAGGGGEGLLEVDPWKLMRVPSFLQTLPLSLFPFLIFALYPFTMIHHSCENDRMLSTVSVPGESLNLGGLGDPGIPSLTFQTSPPPILPQRCDLVLLFQQCQSGSHLMSCFLCLK